MAQGSRVIHVLMGSGKGGIEVLIPRLIHAMRPAKMQVYVVRGKSTGEDCVFHNTDIEVEKGGVKRLDSIVGLYLYARSNRDAVFHGYNLGPVNLLALWLAGAGKVVYSIHGTVYWKSQAKRLPIRAAWVLALLKKPMFISNSQYSAQVFREKINSKVKIHTIYNPIELSGRAPSHSSLVARGENNTLSIIYVGRLASGKNLKLWLEVAKHLLSVFPNARFRLYGKGPLCDELGDYARELGIGASVEFIGFMDDIAAAYYSADLLLFLSQYESFGNVVVESILAGTPVICSDIPSMREIFAAYPDFIVGLDSKLKESVVNKIRQLDHLKKLAEKAKPEFAHKFSLARYIKEVQSVYDSFPS